MTMKPPPRHKDHPRRFLDAQQAVEQAVLRIVEDAVAAGWGPAEITAAIVTVAENKLLALSEDAYLEDLAKRFKNR
mgnify:CR=1 FL=1